jgi:hypothetical protein
MKHIKGFLFAITGMLVLVTLVSLLMPSKVMVAKTTMINASRAKVLNAIGDLQNWKYWHPVFMDSSSRIVMPGQTSGVGAVAEWETSGIQNKIRITAVTNESVQLSLQRKGENDVVNLFQLAGIKDSSSVQVEWRMLATMKWYPLEKFSGIFFDKMTGPGCELALQNLKNYLEKREGINQGN